MLSKHLKILKEKDYKIKYNKKFFNLNPNLTLLFYKKEKNHYNFNKSIKKNFFQIYHLYHHLKENLNLKHNNSLQFHKKIKNVVNKIDLIKTWFINFKFFILILIHSYFIPSIYIYMKKYYFVKLVFWNINMSLYNIMILLLRWFKCSWFVSLKLYTILLWKNKKYIHNLFLN